MQLRIDGLEGHLGSGLAPCYLVAGDEPLLVEESLDVLRAHARDAGFVEREVLHADASFDWGRLQAAGETLSLFGDRRLLELRLPTGKPGTDGAKALQAFCARPPEDTVLVVVTGGLDKRQRESAWAKAVERAGAMLYLWPIKADQLPVWIEQRCRAAGFQPTPEARDLLAQRGEGNLLAAAQEIEKLCLLAEPGPLDLDTVREATTNSARFDTFDLPAAVLAGDSARVLRVVSGLRQEGEEVPPVLGALARDLRALVALQAVHRVGERPDDVFRAHRIWRGQQARLWRCATSAPPGRWAELLPIAARVDRFAKGAARGRVWDELLSLALAMAMAASGRRAVLEA